MTVEWIGTRAEGLARLEVFSPSMGRRYTNGRNYDLGAGKHKAVSLLSPYIRRRLVTEEEVIARALQEHGPEDSEKFVEEVIWRNYFKGWMERRPSIWSSYRSGLEADLAALERDRRLRRDVDRATNGKTGIECFDAWAVELSETGYLHNHARMWFASIWIFTLGLPWRVGADFFYRHLLDGDAAANTLGWRWVAGLHTRGKPYPATAENISTYTNGRFRPARGELADVTHGLEATEPDGLPSVLPVRTITPPKAGVPTALLITDEDCRLEDYQLTELEIRSTATLRAAHLRSPLAVSERVFDFEQEALADAASRLRADAVAISADHPDSLAKWATAVGAEQIVTPFITRGPHLDWIEEAKPYLMKKNIAFTEVQRDWDLYIWPHATAGFFKVKQKIPSILDKFFDVR